jgi:S-DNA-T family DNA segregation ATPase FtsK/SpoIIIE
VAETAGLLVGLVPVLAFDLLVWRLGDPPSFERLVSVPLRASRRRNRYRRRWNTFTVGLGLAVVSHRPKRKGSELVTTVPRLGKVHCGPYVDRLVVRPIIGQNLGHYEAVRDAAALHLGAVAVRVALEAQDRLRLDILRVDPLANTIPAAVPVPGTVAHVDLSCLPVGLREDGTPWAMSLLNGNHTFICGATSAGKSSVVWNVLAGLAPAVAAGTVQLRGVDPKCMEFTFAPAMFHRLATMPDFEGMVQLLEEAVEDMQARAARYAGRRRTHTPTVEEPFVVVLVDEIGFVTAYGGTKVLRERAHQAIAALTTQGRAVGFVLIGAAQDPRKEVVALRNLFPVKIGLRLDEAAQVKMVLGEGAREQGAECDRIPDTLPGVAYVKVDGVREPQRVRSAYLGDDDVHALADAFAAPGRRLELLDDEAA